jgi:Arc/MetJ family transcription regulator
MSVRRKKTWLLDQSLIHKVRRIYGTRTETEAVTRALQEVVFREDLKKALLITAGKIPRIQKVF